MKFMKTLGCVVAAAILSSCATAPNSMADGGGPGLWLVPINHTDRYATYVAVDDVWAGNVGRQGGGGGAACCLGGRRDWSKPVLVKWRWGAEGDPVSKKITIPGEEHSALVAFPRPPRRLDKPIDEKWSREDYAADDHYLCVIFRTTDTVEFAYSSSGSGCRNK
ncbi:MAG: DUF3304 domain-containing protein [Azonexus sp.]|nr:DUF3304 domain-containing protein [Azonexus sp.]